MRLSINFAPKADFDHRDCFRFVVDFINQPVGSDSDSPGLLGTFHQLAAYWSGIVAEGDQLFFNLFVEGRGNGIKFFLGLSPNRYGIAHLRLRRISSRACSSGIATSPEAFASWYSRIASKSSSSSRISSYSLMSRTTAMGDPLSPSKN